MNTHSKAHTMDGFDVWFFGGTPGPGELDQGCTLTAPHVPSIDEDDARIPAFAHRCDCGQHAQRVQQSTPRQTARPSLLALHV